MRRELHRERASLAGVGAHENKKQKHTETTVIWVGSGELAQNQDQHLSGCAELQPFEQGVLELKSLDVSSWESGRF